MPVRVISEGMGAYVQWVPDKRLVVVRYIPATPPPSPAPPPPAPPPPPPAPVPTHVPNVFFLAGDYLISPKVYNQFAPGVQPMAVHRARRCGVQRWPAVHDRGRL